MDEKKKFAKMKASRFIIIILTVAVLSSVLIYSSEYSLPKGINAFSETLLPARERVKETEENAYASVSCNKDITGKRLYVGGMPFGIKLYTDGVLISGVSEVDCEGKNVSPGEKAGLKCGDIIKKINGEEAYGIVSVLDAAQSSKGEKVKLTVQRGQKLFETEITPLKSKSSNAYSFGLWVRDGTAGIGTVTYIDPETNSFGGLGHGVCEASSGELLPMNEGKVNEVTINGIEKGKKGDPGELQGYFSSEDKGIIISNTEYGIFGVYNSVDTSSLRLMETGDKSEVSEGLATILCTLDSNNICEYGIEIERITNKDSKTKNFIIKVIDKALLEKTGGIVQGMSGSPIIQNGKLVGAVTHVLLDDPERGYGIFIGNMLENN